MTGRSMRVLVAIAAPATAPPAMHTAPCRTARAFTLGSLMVEAYVRRRPWPGCSALLHQWPERSGEGRRETEISRGGEVKKRRFLACLLPYSRRHTDRPAPRTT
eukprot:scaffold155343_cov29-Tisochrysis_lutea.AAC.2